MDKITYISQNFLSYLIYLREILLVFCKLLSIILFSYYIIKVHEYEITWIFLVNYMPVTTSFINDIFTFFGTTLLIIPLSLIITSFFYDNKVLQIITTMLTFAGSLFAVFFGIFNRSLLENINLKFLEDKREQFLEKFKLTNNLLSQGSEAKSDYILKHLTPSNQKLFDTELIQFKAVDDVHSYAHSLCLKLSEEYDAILKASTVSKPMSLFDYITPGTFVAIVVGIIYYVGSSNTDTIKKVGEIQSKINHLELTLANQNVQAMGTTANALANAGTPLSTTIPNDLSAQYTALSGLHSVLNERLTILETTVDNIPKVMAETSAKSQQLFETLAQIMRSSGNPTALICDFEKLLFT